MRHDPANRQGPGRGDGGPQSVLTARPLEHKARADHKDAIAYCESAGDDLSPDTLVDIMDSEDEHLNWLETSWARSVQSVWKTNDRPPRTGSRRIQRLRSTRRLRRCGLLDQGL